MSNKDPEIYSVNLPLLETLYNNYVQDPSSIPADWRTYFQDGKPAPTTATGEPFDSLVLQGRVDQLIRNYRVRGHRIAKVDPLGLRKLTAPELELEANGLSENDLARTFSCGMPCDGSALTLKEIVDRLRTTYCRSIGVQYMHIDDPAIRGWLQSRMESTQNRIELQKRDQLRILTRLTDAVLFEEFIRKKFLGAKSFSLEGSESLIPLLDLAIEKAGQDGIQEIVLGMAHRGRLNVLANVLGKKPVDIFREFVDAESDPAAGDGDVKYHLGHSSDWTTDNGHTVHLSLCFNPSHLEFVNPVATGRTRAKQDRVNDDKRERGMVLLIHGDAGFAGQGIIQETLNLSELAAYTTGGTFHVVVNNQIGFTTLPDDATSSTYVTDVARMLQIPIFHVNGEDPEAVAQAVDLSMDFRKTFHKDVVIDLFCYRKLGHSEGDEPTFTQPVMYHAIAERKSVRAGYLDHLLKLGSVSPQEADEIERQGDERLRKEFAELEQSRKMMPVSSLKGLWESYSGGSDGDTPEVETGVDPGQLIELLNAQTRLPKDFHIHPKLKAGIQHRLEMAAGTRRVDWATAEALAFATLAAEGVRIRMTGQDAERGTFSQRHAVLHDFENGEAYVPLQNVAPYQAPVEIRNSPLSEAAVLGFEYGYSLDYPDALVVWEAQYGDFANAAQVIIDQFIATAEDKWRRLSGLVLLLPHGWEGAGPEHSSARLERFLQLAAEDNIQVTVPTTPAQYFHLLRRQVLRRWRKPLIVMTPKSFLRNPQATSELAEFSAGRFQRIVGDSSTAPEKAEKILLCAGKVYYDLARAIDEQKLRERVRVLRLEQLYPLPDSALVEAFARYRDELPVLWVQEEPENMGAWPYLRHRFGQRLLDRFPFGVSARPASASPATGSGNRHKAQQHDLIAHALDL